MKEENRAIKVLHIVTGIGFGGVRAFLYGYYKFINRDVIHFDIVAINSGKEQPFAEAFRELGANVYYMPKNYVKRLWFLFKYLSTHKYDIVHSHIDIPSAVYLLIAKILGIKIRISHAHRLFEEKSTLTHNMMRKLLIKVSTHKWGCSMESLRGLFGDAYATPENIVYNAMEIDKFIFNPIDRNKYRKDMGLTNRFVVGFVGRLSPEKNVIYLLKIFNELYGLIPNAMLMVCGDGELKNDMHKVIKQLGIEDRVMMLGNRTDVNSLMQAMDVFVLPSHFEGLGIVLIEAQAASLRCVATKGTIPLSTKVTDYIDYINLDVNPKVWATYIKEHCMDYPRKNMRKEIVAAHYDITVEAKKLEHKYLTTVK